MNTIRAISVTENDWNRSGAYANGWASGIDSKRRPNERVVALKDGGPFGLIVYFEREVPFRSRIRTHNR
jgi:hypothetical protein